MIVSLLQTYLHFRLKLYILSQFHYLREFLEFQEGTKQRHRFATHALLLFFN